METYMGSQIETANFLSRLTVEIGRSLGIDFKPINTDIEGSPETGPIWMYNFDAFESAIYRQYGADVERRDLGLSLGFGLDITDAKNKIISAIKDLNP